MRVAGKDRRASLVAQDVRELAAAAAQQPIKAREAFKDARSVLEPAGFSASTLSRSAATTLSQSPSQSLEDTDTRQAVPALFSHSTECPVPEEGRGRTYASHVDGRPPRRLERLYIKPATIPGPLAQTLQSSGGSSSGYGSGRGSGSLRLTLVDLRITTSPMPSKTNGGPHNPYDGCGASLIADESERSLTVAADEFLPDTQKLPSEAGYPCGNTGRVSTTADLGPPAAVKPAVPPQCSQPSSPRLKPGPASAASQGSLHARGPPAWCASTPHAVTVAAAQPSVAAEAATKPTAPAERCGSCRISMKLHASHVEQLKPKMIIALSKLLLPYGWALVGTAVRAGCLELVLDYTLLEGPWPGGTAAAAGVPQAQVAGLVAHLHKQGLVDAQAEPRVAVQVDRQVQLAQWRPSEVPVPRGGSVSEEPSGEGEASRRAGGAQAAPVPAGSGDGDVGRQQAGGGSWGCRAVTAIPEAVAAVQLAAPFVVPTCLVAPSAGSSTRAMLYVGARHGAGGGLQGCSVRCLGRFLPVTEVQRVWTRAVAAAMADRLAGAVPWGASEVIRAATVPAAAADGACADHAQPWEPSIDWASVVAAASAAGVDGEVLIVGVDDLPEEGALLQVELRMPPPSDSVGEDGEDGDPPAAPRAAPGSRPSSPSHSEAQQLRDLVALSEAAPVLVLPTRLNPQRRNAPSGEARAQREGVDGGVAGWDAEAAACEVRGLGARMAAKYGSAVDASAAAKELLFDMGLLLDVASCMSAAPRAAAADDSAAGAVQPHATSDFPSHSDDVRALLRGQLGLPDECGASGDIGGREEDAAAANLFRQHLADIAVTVLAGCAELTLPYIARLTLALASYRLSLGDEEAMVEGAAGGCPGIAAQLRALLYSEQQYPQQQRPPGPCDRGSHHNTRASDSDWSTHNSSDHCYTSTEAPASWPFLTAAPIAAAAGPSSVPTLESSSVGAVAARAAFNCGTEVLRRQSVTLPLSVSSTLSSVSIANAVGIVRHHSGSGSASGSGPAAATSVAPAFAAAAAAAAAHSLQVPLRYQRFAEVVAVGIDGCDGAAGYGQGGAGAVAAGAGRQAAASVVGALAERACNGCNNSSSGQLPAARAAAGPASEASGIVAGVGRCPGGLTHRGALRILTPLAPGAKAAAAGVGMGSSELQVEVVGRPQAVVLLRQFGAQLLACFMGYDAPAMEHAFWLDTATRLQPMCVLYAAMTLVFVSLAVVRSVFEDGWATAAFMGLYQGGQAALLACFGLWGAGRPGWLFVAVVASTVLRCVCHALLSRGLAPLPSFVLPVCRAWGDIFNEGGAKALFEQLPMWLFCTLLVFLEIPTAYALYLYMDGNGQGLLTGNVLLRLLCMVTLKLMTAVGTQAVRRMWFQANYSGRVAKLD